MARNTIRADEWLLGRFKKRFSKRQWASLFGGQMLLMGKKAAGPLYEVPDYANTNGSGNRTYFQGTGKFTTSGATFWGTLANPSDAVALFNGLRNDGGNWQQQLDKPATGEWLQWDFPDLCIITEIKFWFYSGTTASQGMFKVQGWNGSAWIDLLASFELGGTNCVADSGQFSQTIAFTNTTGYLSYRIIGISGVTVGYLYYWGEMDFKIGNVLP